MKTRTIQQLIEWARGWGFLQVIRDLEVAQTWLDRRGELLELLAEPTFCVGCTMDLDQPVRLQWDGHALRCLRCGVDALNTTAKSTTKYWVDPVDDLCPHCAESVVTKATS